MEYTTINYSHINEVQDFININKIQFKDNIKKVLYMKESCFILGPFYFNNECIIFSPNKNTN